MKRVIKTILGSLGYEINKARFHPSYLAQICQPKTVFDVGVGNGTYALYEAFPKAKFVLVEPHRDYENAIEIIAKKYDCDIFYNAVSNTPGTPELKVDTIDPLKSTLEKRAPLTVSGNPLEKRVIEVTTLDRIIGEIPDLQKPILLKIDTEGHELKLFKAHGPFYK